MRLRIVRKLWFPLTMGLLAITAIEGHAESGNLQKVEFDEATLDEIIGFFRSGAGSGGKTRNILLDPRINKDTKVSLRLHDVSRGVAFAYVAEIAGFDYREEKHALRLFPLKGEKPPVRSFLKRGGPMTWRRASGMQMPKVEFESTELSEIVNDITAASRHLDPKKKGLNIILGHGVDPTTPVTLSLRNVPVSTVLKYVAEFARLKLRADGSAIVLMTRPQAERSE
ncbi:MAG: hypothetical protein GWO24_01885 [Akkermansiaceae bacterium]|nr:hypothetical protein [Akkermansiaceae bacterium]